MFFSGVRRFKSQGLGNLGAGRRHAGFIYNPLNKLEYFLLTRRDTGHEFGPPVPV